MAPSGRRCSQTIPFPPLPPPSAVTGLPPSHRRRYLPPPPALPPPRTYPLPRATPPTPTPLSYFCIRPLAIEAYATPVFPRNLAILATSTPPWLFTPHAQTLPPRILFSPLFSPFTSPPHSLPARPPLPPPSRNDETQPLTLSLLRIINFSHT